MPSDGANQFYDNTYQYDDIVSWQHGRHGFKFGVETRLQQFNINIRTGTSGQFNFDTGPTSSPSDSNSGFGFASFYRGAASNAYIALPEQLGWRVKYYAGFVQDDWKVSPKLTANLGFRYEIPTPVTEAHGQQSFVDPTLPNPGAGGTSRSVCVPWHRTGQAGKSTTQDTFHSSYGPRVGLAYQLTPSTVVRTGYGIYYQNLKIGGFGENDSAGFFGSYRYPTPASPQTPEVVLSQITAYPGPTPPFIDPTVLNGQSPTFIMSKTARPGTTQTWTLDVQQQLPAKMLVGRSVCGRPWRSSSGISARSEPGKPCQPGASAQCLHADINAQATDPACAGQPPCGDCRMLDLAEL